MVRKLFRPVMLAAAFALPSFGGDRALAGEVSDESGEISIEVAAVELAREGSFAGLHLVIENSGERTVRVMRVSTDLGELGGFDVHSGSGSVHSDGFSIGPGEKLTFGKTGRQLRIGPLKRDLREGDVVKLTFTFDRWSTTLPVHVHARPGTAERREDTTS